MLSGKDAKRRLLVIACAAATGVLILLVTTLSGGHAKTNAFTSARPATRDPVAPAGITFSYLAAQRSNRCGLTAAGLESYPQAQHLQGSCCYPMDDSTYEWQLRALRRYSAIPQIPRNPYDVPVSLALQLLHYDNAIDLSARQKATYDEAMHMSRTRGPCCCRCWRWSAFKGMSKYLLARERWTASRVALLIDDLQGCGGKDGPPQIPGRATA